MSRNSVSSPALFPARNKQDATMYLYERSLASAASLTILDGFHPSITPNFSLSIVIPFSFISE